MSLYYSCNKKFLINLNEKQIKFIFTSPPKLNKKTKRDDYTADDM